jgi:hypothetical protein
MATKANLTVDQNSDYSVTLNLTDQNGDIINLSGYTAFSSMRKWYDSTNSIPFITSINTTAGTLTLSMSANTTANLWPVRYVYDVIINNGAITTRIVEGEVFVTPAVTGSTIETANG